MVIIAGLKTGLKSNIIHTNDIIKQIADIMINNLVMRVKANGIEIKVDSKAKELIAKTGADKFEDAFIRIVRGEYD